MGTAATASGSDQGLPTESEVTKAARAAYTSAKETGLDDGAALDNAHEVVRDLVGARTGYFDDETLAWTYDEEVPS